MSSKCKDITTSFTLWKDFHADERELGKLPFSLDFPFSSTEMAPNISFLSKSQKKFVIFAKQENN